MTRLTRPMPTPPSATATRRQCLLTLAALAASTSTSPAEALAASPHTAPRLAPATIDPGHALRFPQDFGAHPALRTEWWYLTGQLQAASTKGATPRTFGFQVTFFRSRVDAAADSRSASAPLAATAVA